jgi:hypothetical protein
VSPGDVVEVNTPQAAVSLLRDWQQRFPGDQGMVLDERNQPIATCRPLPVEDGKASVSA